MDPYAGGPRRLRGIAGNGRAGDAAAPAKPVDPQAAPRVAGVPHRGHPATKEDAMEIRITYCTE